MKKFLLTLLAAGLLAHDAVTAELDLSPVPESLAQTLQVELENRRTEILGQWKRFEAKRAAFYAEFGRTIATDSPRAPEATKRKNALKEEGEGIAEQAGIYEADLISALQERLASLQKQIDESRKQALQSGFAGQAEEFERIGQTSAEAVQRMKTQLIARLQDVLLQKVQSAAQDKILDRVKKLTPAQVDHFEAFARKAGTPSPEIVRVLRTITAGENPARLAADAEALLEGIGQANELFEFPEKAAQETVEARQEAALILLSFVMEHPVLDKLKTVGHAGYNVGEAWFYYFNLSSAARDLLQTTDKQLMDQKVLAQRLEELFKAKHAAQADLKRLQAE